MEGPSLLAQIRSLALSRQPAPAARRTGGSARQWHSTALHPRAAFPAARGGAGELGGLDLGGEISRARPEPRLAHQPRSPCYCAIKVAAWITAFPPWTAGRERARLPARLLSQPRCRTGSHPVSGTSGIAANWPRGELIMADQARLTPAWGGPAGVRSCWMCGMRLSADQMVADGGSACADVRWYCLDRRGCTERWTSRPAGSDVVGQVRYRSFGPSGTTPAGGIDIR